MRELRRLLGYLKPYMVRMVLAALLVSISGALMAAVVATLNPLVNEVFLGQTTADAVGQVGGEPDIIDRLKSMVGGLLPVEAFRAWTRANAFVQVPLMMVGIFFVRGILLYFGNYQTLRCGASVIRDLRVELTEKITHQSLDFFQDNPTGVISSRVVSDVQRLQRVATTVLADLLRVGGMVPFVFIGSMLADWRMSLLSFAGLPLLSVPMIRLGRRLRRAATGSQLSMADVMSRLQEAVTGVKVVQGFGMEDYEVGRMRDALQRMLRADLRAARAQALSPSIMELLGAILGAGLFYIAGRSIANNSLDGGSFTVVLASLGILFVSIRRLNRLYAEIQVARSAATRVFDMLDQTPTIRERADAKPLPAFHSEVCFRDVSFNYGDGPVLHDIDLTVAHGETIALVGRSGSGKSTLA
ncbi:MAG: ABC transporter ATP-binding protein, partial [Acidobacteriota bacterium]|nr:ABC transporter ATP-binding protein [Acidobacteriota bacterium]